MSIKVGSEQPGITAQTFFSSERVSLNIKIPADIGASQISECLKPSPKKYPTTYFQIDIERSPFEDRIKIPHDWLIFDASKGPWLSKSILDLLEKMKRYTINEQEAVRLMRDLAERASEHYDLKPCQFAAITLSGKIADLADTKIELLKKVQGKRYREQIFLWEVGSESFTGWK